MANCVYCGEPAGWFKNSHPPCKAEWRIRSEKNMAEKREKAEKEKAEKLAKEEKASQQVTAFFNNPQPDMEIPDMDYEPVWDNVFTQLEPLDREGLQLLNRAQEILELEDDFLEYAEERDSYQRLYDFLDNDILPDVYVEGLNLQKSERAFTWLHSVTLHEERTQTRTVGANAGFSVRGAPGLWLHSGKRAGQVIKEDYWKELDTGVLVLTNKHVYFKGASKAFRIRLDKIIGLQFYGDGIDITKESASGKTQHFAVSHGIDKFEKFFRELGV